MFGPIEKDWLERDKYCKFKLVGILKCIKTGEEPPRGNPFAPEEAVVTAPDNSMNEASNEEEKQ